MLQPPEPLTDVTETLIDLTRRTKSFTIAERASDSPFVEAVWHAQAVSIPTRRAPDSGPIIFPAVCHWTLLIARQPDRATVTLWGPGTQAVPVPYHGEIEFHGIVFKFGTFMPSLPPLNFRDDKDLTLPDATKNSFLLDGSAWRFPAYENMDTFVDRLARTGLLVHDEIVEAALRGQVGDLSPRTVQRRFMRATGLTQRAVQQIRRARFAKHLLGNGVSIVDTTSQAGYYDQAHLTRSLRKYVGFTPTQIAQRGSLK
jgi:AraC-like DNA-binding protein